jgi:acyl dehydratase
MLMMEEFLKPNRRAEYGLDLSKVFIGKEILSRYNITVDESVLSMWSGFMPTSSYPENSREFAGRLGFHQIFLPYGFLLNLTLSLGVENFAHSSVLKLELKEVLYLAPAFPGDTFSCTIKIMDIRPARRPGHSVIESSHLLFNQKGEPVFSLVRISLFPEITSRKTILSERKNPFHNNRFKENILARTRSISMENVIFKFNTGDLLLHPYVRPIGKSENLFWATYLKNTHPSHYNYQRYQPGEIIVSGGIVLAMVIGIAGREFRQILMQQVSNVFHVESVFAEDRLGAFSYVREVRHLMPGFEEISIRTFGLRNMDTEPELSDVVFPKSLFHADVELPSDVRKIIEEKCPSLKGKVCCMVNWTVLRKVDE